MSEGVELNSPAVGTALDLVREKFCVQWDMWAWVPDRRIPSDNLRSVLCESVASHQPLVGVSLDNPALLLRGGKKGAEKHSRGVP